MKLLRGLIGIGILFSGCMLAIATQKPPNLATKPIALTSVQVRYFEQVNQDIENLSEVKALRAKQQAFITGIATSHGITGSWRLTPDGNGGLFLDAETKP